MFISITTPIVDMFLDLREPLLVKKVMYRRFHISEEVRRPPRLKTLFIVREGTTRQIVNLDELVGKLKEEMGERVWVACCVEG